MSTSQVFDSLNEELIKQLEARLLQLEEQKKKFPVTAPAVEWLMDEIRDRISDIKAGRKQDCEFGSQPAD